MNRPCLSLSSLVSTFVIVAGLPTPQMRGLSNIGGNYALSGLGWSASGASSYSPGAYNFPGEFLRGQSDPWQSQKLMQQRAQMAQQKMQQMHHSMQQGHGQQPGYEQGHLQGGQPSSWSLSHSGPEGSFQMGGAGSGGVSSQIHQSASAPGAFGVSSSSSSSSWTGPDGKMRSKKSVTVGLNNNGRMHYQTIES